MNITSLTTGAMELSLYPHKPSFLPSPAATSCKPPKVKFSIACSKAKFSEIQWTRRAFITCFLASAAAGLCVSDVASAASTSRRANKGAKVPESEYTTLPNGLKYYDLKVGNGAEAVKGSRVAVHYVAKWRNITFMTSRQGLVSVEEQ
ncbi:peptidyl-prolyl cis-trans isomerase FKBP16-4, chloroplastic-like [Bidens hawaiensis]|uniref:peptidyl-prolyl cis-trans isomerase FKBP16-4, chloroplastic-like n=1 Tax=Bidens hawaiensis TaxID=980011 RepID=UPI00404A283E